MLLGTYYSHISAKGRVALPARFKKETGSRIVIARWYENCLVIVGQSQWESFLSRFARMEDVVTKPIRSVERHILATAYEAETDNQGRFVIPPLLRIMAGLNDKIVFLGLGQRVELWSQEVWEKEEARVGKEADQMLEEIAKLRNIK